MYIWFVFNEFCEVYCEAKNRVEAERIAHEINGYTRCIYVESKCYCM